LPTDPDTKGRSWCPDIIIREDAGEKLLSNTKYTDLVVKATGSVYNEVTGEILVLFSPLIDYYPFDR